MLVILILIKVVIATNPRIYIVYRVVIESSQPTYNIGMLSFCLLQMRKLGFLFLFFTLSSGIHVQNMQDCYRGIHVPWWFATPINLLSRFKAPHALGICANALLPLAPHPLTVLSVMSTSLCSCVLIVQLLLMSENVQCLVFCSCVSLLRMMVSSFIHIPAKDMNSFFFMAA